MATRIAYESGTSRRPSFTAWNLTVGQALDEAEAEE